MRLRAFMLRKQGLLRAARDLIWDLLQSMKLSAIRSRHLHVANKHRMFSLSGCPCFGVHLLLGV